MFVKWTVVRNSLCLCHLVYMPYLYVREDKKTKLKVVTKEERILAASIQVQQHQSLLILRSINDADDGKDYFQ